MRNLFTRGNTDTAVVYNTTELCGICPPEVYEGKKLTDGVSAYIEITKGDLDMLFDYHQTDISIFKEKVIDMLHQALLNGNEKVNTKVIGGNNRPYGDTDFIR